MKMSSAFYVVGMSASLAAIVGVLSGFWKVWPDGLGLFLALFGVASIGVGCVWRLGDE